MSLKYLLVIFLAVLTTAAVVVFYTKRKGEFHFSPEMLQQSVGAGDSIFYSSGLTQRQSLTLADSSRIMLNPNTQVHIPKNFGVAHREIYLDGDAYFEVPPADGGSPFSVHTRELTLLFPEGTTRISAFAKDEGESAEVLDGKVMVQKAYASKDHEPEVLGQGDMVMINQSIDLMEKETYDTTSLLAWKQDDLVFDHTSFPDVLRRLEDWYGVDIQTTGSVGNPAPLSASFHHAGLTEVLHGLQDKYHCKYAVEKYKARLDF
jgi:ferric-dicitrate binding protein FerR (iron transport regulator)